MIETRFDFKEHFSTVFCKEGENSVWLKKLFGLNCDLDDFALGIERKSGLAVIDTDQHRFGLQNLKLRSSEFDSTSALLEWELGESGIKLVSKWQYSQDIGIWSRNDTICNNGNCSVKVRSCFARFYFSPGLYQFYSQASHWCNENQGIWQDVVHGNFILGSEGGRTTQGATPYMCLRDKRSGNGIAFHIVPLGNWMIKINSCTIAGHLSPSTVVEIGISDKYLDLPLQPGASFQMPEILIQALPEGEPEFAGANLHESLLNEKFIFSKTKAPVVYNTWYDFFECLEVDRLREQLNAAKEIGCEVFVVDAGWYGDGDGDWFKQAGDWREKKKAAFKGKMVDFADEVRQAGLKFGLWMEPERNFTSAPVLKKNPEWFLHGSSGYYYPDLTKQKAYDYIFSEISRLVEKYGLAWMKVDFNFELGFDPYMTEFACYYNNWYKLMDEIRLKYPDVFFEGCASGGMRSDINTLSHFDAHFLSDNVNPCDSLRIYQQALLRLPPGRITKWVALRSIGKTIPPYGSGRDDIPERLVVPSGNGATWNEAEISNVNFAVRVAMAGMLGFSGDIASLSQDIKKKLLWHVNFYKKWREFIVTSKAHLLTPCSLKGDHEGWVGIQLQDMKKKVSILFVYRLNDSNSTKYFYLRDLEKGKMYSLHDIDENRRGPLKKNGFELMRDGLLVKLDNKYDASVIVISKK